MMTLAEYQAIFEEEYDPIEHMENIHKCLTGEYTDDELNTIYNEVRSYE